MEEDYQLSWPRKAHYETAFFNINYKMFKYLFTKYYCISLTDKKVKNFMSLVSLKKINLTL